MRYAVACVADQTHAYLTGPDKDAPITTKYAEAHLFDRADAEAAVDAYCDRCKIAPHQGCGAWMETVVDEVEWRKQADTW